MKTFTNHVYGYHLISQTPPTLTTVTENYSDSLCSSGDSGDEVEITNVNTESCPELDALVEDFQQAVRSHAAAWILKTKEGHKLTQTAMDDIIQEVTALNQFILSKVHIAIQTALNKAGISESCVPAISEICHPNGPFGKLFRGLETAYQQLRYYKANLGMVVSSLEHCFNIVSTLSLHGMCCEIFL